MRKLILILTIFTAFLTKMSGQGTELLNLGLIAQLVEMKYVSEAYLSATQSNTAISEADKKKALANYNAVRIQIDRIVYQLIMDMRTQNSPRKFKKMSKYYKSHKLSDTQGAKKCVKNYVVALSKAHETYETTINPDKDGKTRTLIETEAVLTLIELGWTIIKETKEMQGKKVDGISEILNNLRLSKPSELENKSDK